MTAVVLQARLDSTRLPGKSLLPLGDKPLILTVMEALAAVPAGRRILACPGAWVSPIGPWRKRRASASFAAPRRMSWPATAWPSAVSAFTG